MKRLTASSALALALLAAAWSFHLRLDVAPHLERLRTQLALEGRASDLSIGAAGLRLLPVPHLAFKAVAVADASSGTQLAAPLAQAAIRPLSLLAGRLEFSDLRLQGPVVHHDLGRSPAAADAVGLLEQTLNLGRSFGRLSVADGELRLLRNGQPAGVLSAVSATWRGGDAPARRSVSARFRLRGQDVALDLGENAVTRAGRNLRLEGRTSHMTVKATLPGPSGPPGDLTVAMSDAGQALAWLGQGSPLSRAVVKLTLDGKLSREEAVWTVNNAKLVMDGQTLEGALSWHGAAPRPLLAGTLAGSSFDLGALLMRLTGARLDKPDMQDWGFDPADIEAGLPSAPRGLTHDLDLRLSLDKATMGKAVLEEAAAQILISPTRIDLSLAQAQTYKGTVKARYSVTRNGGMAESRLQFGFDKLDLAAITLDFTGARRLAGSGTGQLVLEGNGTNLKSLVRTATGRANLSIRQGEVLGFSLAETLRRMERQPLIALRDWRSGRSGFDTATFAGPISQGVLELTEGAVIAPGFILTLGGRISLAEQGLALKGLLASPAGRGLQIPFAIDGNWQSPDVRPSFNPAALQRTGAEAAPAR